MTRTPTRVEWMQRIEQAIEDCSLPRMLPVLACRGEAFFVDARLREFRKVDDPSRTIRFESSRGEEMIESSRLTRCPFCRQPAVTWVDASHAYVTCRRCGRAYPADLE